MYEFTIAVCNFHGMNYKSILYFLLKNVYVIQVLENDIIIGITLNLCHIIKIINQTTAK